MIPTNDLKSARLNQLQPDMSVAVKQNPSPRRGKISKNSPTRAAELSASREYSVVSQDGP